MSGLVVVCHGNRWRSPLAAALLRARGYAVVSAGVGPVAAGGHPIASAVRQKLVSLGLSPEGRSQQLTQEMLVGADLLLYMDNGNLRRLVGYDLEGLKVVCLGGYIGEPRIPDPAFLPKGPQQERIFDMIIRACQKV